jgi:hypothetical protein
MTAGHNSHSGDAQSGLHMNNTQITVYRKQSNIFDTKSLSGSHLCMIAGHNPLMVMPSPFCT